MNNWRETAIDKWRPGAWWAQWVLGEDERGELLVPQLRGSYRWRGRFSPVRPWHWPFWGLSRLTGAIAMVESDG